MKPLVTGEALALVDAGDATGDATLHVRALAALGAAPSVHPRAALEELLGRPSRRLAAYGTLRPGESNHAQVSALRGRWSRGTVRGSVVILPSGYPGLVPDPHARAPVGVLESDDLPAAWSRLDRFEGDAYHRHLVDVALEGGGSCVAYLYLAYDPLGARPRP